MMKKQVRHGVFETNSSSMHSLVIKKKDEYYTEEEILDGIYLWDDGSWHLYEDSMEFGRSPFRVISSFYDKFMYVMAALVTRYNDDTYNEMKEIAFKYIPGLTNILLPTTTDSCPVLGAEDNDYNRKYGRTEEDLVKYLSILEKIYGRKIDYWTNNKETSWRWEIPYTGYAEDYGMLRSFLDEKNISIEEFLMNKRYIIIQDGDEYGYFGDLKESGLFNSEAVDYEYPEDKNYEED